MPTIDQNGCLANSYTFGWHTPDVGGPEYNYGSESSRITVPVVVPWADVENRVRRGFLHSASVVTISSGGAAGYSYISRNIPYAYPASLDNNGDPWLYAESISRITGAGAAPGNVGEDTLGGPLYEWAPPGSSSRRGCTTCWPTTT